MGKKVVEAALLCIGALVFSGAGSVAKKEMMIKTENQLREAKSPYLKSASEQPVHWHLWSQEAFARALREDKPVLLDIGAVWCHWCHVIDREGKGRMLFCDFIQRGLDRFQNRRGGLSEEFNG